MRELLAYYTNYMNELVQDPNTSTDLISATQEMIDSLIKNMESADGIEEVNNERMKSEKSIYDLSGRQIVNRKSLNSKLPRGVYIINGKKVLVK